MSIVILFIAIGFFALSVLHFCERGPLLNNAFLWATQEERKQLDKKPHYRQSAVAFFLLGVIFSLIALETLLHTGWLYTIIWAVALIAVVYAIASSVKHLLAQ